MVHCFSLMPAILMNRYSSSEQNNLTSDTSSLMPVASTTWMRQVKRPWRCSVNEYAVLRWVFAMCGVKMQVLNVMERTGLIEEVGREHMFPDSKAAVAALTERIHDGIGLPKAGCNNCPLTKYIPKSSVIPSPQCSPLFKGGAHSLHIRYFNEPQDISLPWVCSCCL